MNMLTSRTNLATKEAGEVTLFSFLTKSERFEAFNTSFLHYILLPLLGLTFIINAIFEWKRLLNAYNKNFETVLGAGSATLTAVLANASIIGTLATGGAFAAGPFLFIGALGAGLVSLTTLLGLNLYRAFKAPKGSVERQHYLQAAANNAFNMLAVGIISTLVVFAMISPAGPALLLGFSIAAMTMTALNLTWRFMPKSFKDTIKSVFGLKKPEPLKTNYQPEPREQAELAAEQQATPKAVAPSATLFPSSFRQYRVKALLDKGKVDEAKAYLVDVIEKKEALLTPTMGTSGKSAHKLSLLAHLKAVVNGGEALLTKVEVMHNYHLAFQSFFAGSTGGDVEDIYNAVAFFDRDAPQVRELLEAALSKSA